MPSLPAGEIQVEQYAPQTPHVETVAKVYAEIPIPKLGIFLARSRMGLRPSEARRLDVSDLKLGQGGGIAGAYLLIPARKSKKKRYRMLNVPEDLAAWFSHPEVVTAFEQISRRFGREPLFRNPNGYGDGRWKETSEKRALAKAFQAAGVEPIRPNEMGRQFFATEQVNAGESIYAVKALLGHSDIKNTERYAKLRPQKIAASGAKVTPIGIGAKVDNGPPAAPSSKNEE
ncbi:MAG: site-specific integrase [bacterium]|nr:site-specific integrase [bacterium]